MNANEIQRILEEQRKQAEIYNKTDKQINSSIWQKGLQKTIEHKASISSSMKGKTLEEMLGEERAAAGREARRQANYNQDYTGRAQKAAETRKANGGYDINPMAGKQHKEETKAKQATKALIRQELKRKLGLGRSDSIPKDILEKEYKKKGL